MSRIEIEDKGFGAFAAKNPGTTLGLFAVGITGTAVTAGLIGDVIGKKQQQIQQQMNPPSIYSAGVLGPNPGLGY